MSEFKLTRRRFVKGLAATALVAGVGGVALGYPFDYELTETDIFIPNLPPAFEGFRVAQLSDVHHSHIVSIEEVRRAVALTQSARADMIVLTGDYTTHARQYIEPCAEELGRLEAPAGVWAVLGNHDHNTDGAETYRALARHRVNTLRNANTRVARGGEELQLVGVDDLSWAQEDFARAFKGIDRARPTLLLSHQPNALDRPETEGVALILSGHTHGGQVRLPLLGAPAQHFSQEFKYLRGRFARGATQLYVSRGAGVIGVPVRLGARPEVAVLRLRTARMQDEG